MAKKKNKKNKILNIGQADSSRSASEDVDIESGEESESKCILKIRLEDRDIPKVDDGISKDDIKNPPPDVIEEWYHKAHVGEYVHLEQVTKNGYTYNTKRIQFEFSRMLEGYQHNLDERGVNPAIEKFSFAQVNKISFINNITNPLRYINYFIEYFDDDDELMRAYFEIMFYIMLDDHSVELDPFTFVEMVHAAFTTDSMIEKITRMVEYNTDENLVNKSDRNYDESIQLTVDHLKAIMGVSCLHKFVIPLVCHYYITKQSLLDNAKPKRITDKDLYYYTFVSFVSAFDKVYNINLYNKLYHTSTTRITKTSNQDALMWVRRERLGVTQTSYANGLMRDFVIDISQKAVFSKSAIIFIHVCMDHDVKNVLMQSDKWEFTEMAQEASDSVNEHQSRWDKYQQEKTFHSQKVRIRSYVSVHDIINRAGKDVGLDFKKLDSGKKNDTPAMKKLQDEYNYYIENIAKPLNAAQMALITRYCSQLMGNTDDVDSMEMPEIVRTIMIMKRDLMSRNYTYIPYFISGKIDVSASKKYNRKRVEKLIKNHPLYDDWKSEFTAVEGLVTEEKLYGEAATMLSCPIVVVDYDNPDMAGMLMRPTEDCVVDEIMRFQVSL